MNQMPVRGSVTDKLQICSQKHDILYSKAREFATHRQLAGPFFKINPYQLQIQDLSDLDSHVPDENKCIPRMESMVLCEIFHSDQPIDVRQITALDFFAYLFSDGWGDACSVRVMEGHLLEQLLVGLHRLENDHKAVSHTTYALANNTRHKRNFYKHAKHDETDTQEETLMLNFTYFARLTKFQPNQKAGNPFQYLRKFWDEEKRRRIEAYKALHKKHKKRPHGPHNKKRAKVSHRSSTTMLQVTPSSPPAEEGSKHAQTVIAEYGPEITDIKTQDNTMRPKKASAQQIIRKHMAAISFIALLKQKQKEKAERLEHAKPEDTHISTNTLSPVKKVRKDSRSEYLKKHRRSVFDNTFKKLGGFEPHVREPLPPLSVKPPAKNIIKLPDFEQCVNDYGEELYLSDVKPLQKRNQIDKLTTKQRLRRNRKELHQKRWTAKEEMMTRRESLAAPSMLPVLQPLDHDSIQASIVKHDTIRLPEEVPTFQEFASILKNDDYYDPRYRNTEQYKGRKIHQRYYLVRCNKRSSVTYTVEQVPERIRKYRRFWGHTNDLDADSNKSLFRESKESLTRMPMHLIDVVRSLTGKTYGIKSSAAVPLYKSDTETVHPIEAEAQLPSIKPRNDTGHVGFSDKRPLSRHASREPLQLGTEKSPAPKKSPEPTTQQTNMRAGSYTPSPTQNTKTNQSEQRAGSITPSPTQSNKSSQSNRRAGSITPSPTQSNKSSQSEQRAGSITPSPTQSTKTSLPKQLAAINSNVDKDAQDNESSESDTDDINSIFDIKKLNLCHSTENLTPMPDEKVCKKNPASHYQPKPKAVRFFQSGLETSDTESKPDNGESECDKHYADLEHEAAIKTSVKHRRDSDKLWYNSESDSDKVHEHSESETDKVRDYSESETDTHDRHSDHEGAALHPVISPTPPEPIPQIVGKLKHFAFQDKSRVERGPPGEATLEVMGSRFGVDEFQNKLAQALEEFVVRREIVTSSLPLPHNSSTSVTFTKITCFERPHDRHL